MTDKTAWAFCKNCGGRFMEVDDPPYEPAHLRDLISKINFWPNWTFCLHLFTEEGEVRGWMFYPVSYTMDSFNFSKHRYIGHVFLVPPSSWNRDTWAAWLLDCLRKISDHETCEAFRIDGVREFAPHHGDGEDPYRIWHISDWATADKSQGE